MHPDDYVRRPKCKFCSMKGKPVYLKPDSYMNNRVLPVCNAGCYHFPHRQGSRYCFFRKNGERKQPGDPDWFDPQEDRYAT